MKKKLMGVALSTMIGVSSFSCINVYASESKAIKDARAKISHITYSLKTNYLGLKNQGQWEIYIKEAKGLINKIPRKENVVAKELSTEVNRDEALVKAVARINQVEKSMTPKEEGGYGNALIPKNVPQWQEYIRLANIDLEKVDKKLFKDQYNELIKRRDIVNNKLQEILDGTIAEAGTVKNTTQNGFRVTRMYNSNDYTSAVTVATEFKKLVESGDLGFDTQKSKVDTVILVDKNDIDAGTLIGPLVEKYNAPVLFLDGGDLQKDTKKAIKDLGFKNAVLISSNSNSYSSAVSELKNMNVTIKDKFIEKDKYILSLSIAKSMGELTRVYLVDGDSIYARDKAITLQSTAYFNTIVVYLPTKNKTPMETRSANGYGAFINKAHSTYQLNDITNEKSLEKIVKTSKEGGVSSFDGVYLPINDNNKFYLNIVSNKMEGRRTSGSYTVMSNGNSYTDSITAIPLMVKMQTALLYGGDKPSVTLPNASDREYLLKERYDGKETNPTKRVFIIGNEDAMKNGVEKKLKGLDY